LGQVVEVEKAALWEREREGEGEGQREREREWRSCHCLVQRTRDDWRLR
jgi:hypothetical protein